MNDIETIKGKCIMLQKTDRACDLCGELHEIIPGVLPVIESHDFMPDGGNHGRDKQSSTFEEICWFRKWYDPVNRRVYTKPFIDTTITNDSSKEDQASMLRTVPLQKPQFTISSLKNVKWQTDSTVTVTCDDGKIVAFTVGDTVYLDNPERYWIAKICSMWECETTDSSEDDMNDRYSKRTRRNKKRKDVKFEALWFYRAEDTILEDVNNRFIRGQEVFSSQHRDINSLCLVVGKCTVQYKDEIHDWKQFCKDKDRYYYRFQYNPSSYAFLDPQLENNVDENDDDRFCEDEDIYYDQQKQKTLKKMSWDSPALSLPPPVPFYASSSAAQYYRKANKLVRMNVPQEIELQRPTNAIFYRAFTLNGTQFEIGDCVFFQTQSSVLPLCQFIGRILALWETRNEEKECQIQWFWHPSDPQISVKQLDWISDLDDNRGKNMNEDDSEQEEEDDQMEEESQSEDGEYDRQQRTNSLNGDSSRFKAHHFHRNELFLSNLTDVVSISEISGKCSVEFLDNTWVVSPADFAAKMEQHNFGQRMIYFKGEIVAVRPDSNCTFWLCQIQENSEPTEDILKIIWYSTTGKCIYEFPLF